MTLASTVAVNNSPEGIPVADKRLGLTASMYAMVIKVVKPATISVLRLVLCSLNLKVFSKKPACEAIK